MEDSQVVQLSALPGWIIGISHIKNRGYRCWLLTAELTILSDGILYTTSIAALTAGRTFIERTS